MKPQTKIAQVRTCACVCECACKQKVRNWAAAMLWFLRVIPSKWLARLSPNWPIRAHLICHPPWENHPAPERCRSYDWLSAAQGHFRTRPTRGWRQRALRNHNWFKSIHTHRPTPKLREDVINWERLSAQMQPTRFELPCRNLASLRSSQGMRILGNRTHRFNMQTILYGRGYGILKEQ